MRTLAAGHARGTAVVMMLCFGLATMVPSIAAGAVPYQWLAKQYSEVLGRGPDSGGWKAYVDWFSANGCTRANLQAAGRGFLTSGEFEGKGYNSPERVFVAYRAILSREPDLGGFDNYVTCLDSGACSWVAVINSVYTSPEFNSLVPSICRGANYRDDMGADRPIPIGGERSQATLQAQLNGGGTVCLNPQEVVYVTSTLSIPAGASLVTCAAADGGQTARFGRLIRDAAFSGALVETRGTIDRVWVDGQRGRFGFDPDEENLSVIAGAVTNSRIAEPAGWTNLHSREPCDASPIVTNNLITAYTSLHANFQWSDGLSIACDGSYVAGNYVIDPTDVGIVIFSRSNGSGQNITVESNTILAAGRSAFGGLVVCDAIGLAGAPCNGSSSRSNVLWTSAFQHFDIGISVGTLPWGPGTGTAGHAENNMTPTNLFIRAKDGIVVDGALNTVVQSNNFSTIQIDTGNSCPMDGGVSADVSGGHATGSIQQYADRAVHGCIAHQ